MAEKMARNIIIGILLLTLYCCQYRSELNSDKNLTKEIEQKITVKSSHIDLSDLNYFEWDSFLVLGPYSNVENIEDKTNLNLDKIRGNGIKFSDSFNLLIFIKSGKVAKISELSRNFGDFTNLEEIIDKRHAKYIKSKHGKITLMNSEIDIIGIPNSAFWAGNDKRGNWFNVEDINRENNMTTISIYDDNTGELILENTFMKICHEDNLHFIENLKDEIAYYDGHKIILNDSCYLMEK